MQTTTKEMGQLTSSKRPGVDFTEMTSEWRLER